MSYTLDNFLNGEILIKIEKHQIEDFLKKLPERILWRSGDKPLVYIPHEYEFPIILMYDKDELSYWPGGSFTCHGIYPQVIDVEDIVFEEAIHFNSFKKSITAFLKN